MNKSCRWIFMACVVFLSLSIGCSTSSANQIKSDSAKVASHSNITTAQSKITKHVVPRASIDAPNLSAYPDLASEVIDLPPYQYVLHGVTDFYFVTKNVSFIDTMKQMDKVLKADKFHPIKPSEFKELTASLSDFKAGSIKNTYQKDNPQHSSIQIIDGGFDKNKLPIIIVRMSS